MKQRGRPPLRAQQGAAKIAQILTILSVFDKARGLGEKWEAVVAKATRTARKRYPQVHVSDTEVKRILARWRSKDAREVYLPSQRVGPGRELGFPTEIILSDRLPDTMGGLLEMAKFAASPKVRSITVTTGPKPTFPRANAATVPRQRPKK